MDHPTTKTEVPFVLGERVISSDDKLIQVRIKRVHMISLTMELGKDASHRPQYRISRPDGGGNEALYAHQIRTIEQARADLIEQFAAAIQELDEAAFENQKLFSSLKEESHE
jgi:hypothetical protein